MATIKGQVYILTKFTRKLQFSEIKEHGGLFRELSRCEGVTLGTSSAKTVQVIKQQKTMPCLISS
jgi:hypothetical protein